MPSLFFHNHHDLALRFIFYLMCFFSLSLKIDLLLFVFDCAGSSLLRVFSGCGEQGLLFVAVLGLLVGTASLVTECGLQGTRAR